MGKEINLLQGIHNQSRCVLLPCGTSVSMAGWRCTIPPPPGRTALLGQALGILSAGTVQRQRPGFLELSGGKVMQVEVMHLETDARKWSSSEYPAPQSQVCWKTNPNRQLPETFIFYFHSLSWSEGKIGEGEKSSRVTKSWDKLCAPTLFPAFRPWADSVTAFLATRPGLQLAANVRQTAVVSLNGEVSWIIFSRVNCLSGTVVESLPTVGIASQHRSTWGALPGSLSVCAALNHTASSPFIGFL